MNDEQQPAPSELPSPEGNPAVDDSMETVPVSPSSPDLSASAPPPPHSPTPPLSTSQGCLTTGLTVVFRLMLLGVGLPLAWLFGVGVAQVWPSSATEPPLQEIALRKANRVVTEVRRLPGRWQVPVVEQMRIEPVPIPTEPVPSLTTPVQVLSDSERQIIGDELVAIATELTTLEKRLVDLETRLGRAQSTASVESRLEALQQSLDKSENLSTANNQSEDPNGTALDGNISANIPETAPENSPDSGIESGADNNNANENAPDTVTPQSLAQQNPLFRVTDLQVTLPSDALFVPGEARLLETAPPLLNTILADLSRYPEASVLIGSHTDDRSEVATSRELSFQQANALKLYFAQNFPEERRWVTLGYGQSQPLTLNQTPESRQRNRRIEIWVDRR